VLHQMRSKSSGVRRRQPGFTLLETMIAMAIFLIIASVIMFALMQMTTVHGTISNRTQMHSSIRSATEVLQQEIGQAGRIALPGGTTSLTQPVTAAQVTAGLPVAVTVASAAGMFTGEQLWIDSGTSQETVTLTSVITPTNTITATFNNIHASGAYVAVAGAFQTGVVPDTLATGASDGTHLKLYGDINGDGNMVYVEYTCDTSTNHALYRNEVAFTSATITNPPTAAMILLPNIQPNPGGTACFSYQDRPVGCTGAACYVTDVSVTLTIQTQNPDPQTKQYQQETKALLNVSPRNVFQAWELMSAGVTNRVQPMPASVATLITQ